MVDGRIEPEDVDNLVAAFQFLAGQECVDSKRVGIGGFCVGASFALMAAAQKSIRDQVAFVNAFGPYFDMRDLAGAIFSKIKVYGNESQPWEPNSLTHRVFVTHLTEDLPSNEQDALRAAFLDGQTLDEGQVELSGEAQAVYRLLKGAPLEDVPHYLGRIPQMTRERMAQVSPRTHLEGLKARVLMMHDRNDNLVPAYESRRLADALKERGNFRHTEYGIFTHVTPTLRGGLWGSASELWRFFRHMHSIMLQAT